MSARAEFTFAILVACSACTISPAGIGSSPTPSSPSRPAPAPLPQPSATGDVETAEEVIDDSNSARTRQGLQLIAANEAMNRAAMQYARELAQRHTISHFSTTPGREDPAKRLTDAGIKWMAVAENLALMSPRPGIAPQVIQGWLNSPPHRENLLNPIYRITGAGVARDEQGNYYVVQMYATLR